MASSVCWPIAWTRSVKGKLNDKPYDHGLHYASLTIRLARCWRVRCARVSRPRTGTARETSSAKPRSALPPLPEPLSSFGAVVADGWLYIYGGHTGTEHEHSAANLSNHFRRIRFWHGRHAAVGRIADANAAAGTALVSHDGKVYRVGGMNARNATPDDEEDLHSIGRVRGI